MISVDRGTGYSRIELEETYSTRGLTSLEVECKPSYEGLKFEEMATITVTVTITPCPPNVTIRLVDAIGIIDSCDFAFLTANFEPP